MEENRIINWMEAVSCMFINDIISHHERDELLMRLQIKLDAKAEQDANCVINETK